MISIVSPWIVSKSTCLSPCPYVTSYHTFHQANYTWHRHACGSISPGAPNYNQNFSSSCRTPLDNSATVAMAVDTFILTKPSISACPNRYVTKAVTSTGYSGYKVKTAEAEEMPVVEQEVRVLEEQKRTLVEYVTAENQGEEYRRLIEPMPQFVADAVTCPSTQVKPSSVVPSISNDRLSISTDLTLSNLT